MSILTTDKITEIFCIVDDFCKEFSHDIKKLQIQPGNAKRHRNRPVGMSESEIITILLLFHFGTFRNFKHFYLFYVKEHLRKEFPKQLSYNRFVEIEHGCSIYLMLISEFCYFIPELSPFTVCFIKTSQYQYIFSSVIRPSHALTAHPLLNNHFTGSLNYARTYG